MFMEIYQIFLSTYIMITTLPMYMENLYHDNKMKISYNDMVSNISTHSKNVQNTS